MSQFVHLHVHTQYSILDGMSTVGGLFRKAKGDGQSALAITDHGNMFGVKDFLDVAEKKFPEIKPIVGCEVYVSPEGRFSRRGKEDQSSNHLILLAKNKTGYHNLVKLVSYAYIEGFYYKPRIDHELLEKYHEGLIACSACLAGEVPRAILHGNLEEAEKTVVWYKNLFGDDYYLELQRHETQDPLADQQVYPMQKAVAEHILAFAQKYRIKIIATNDVHFENADDAEAHDRLICLNTGADLNDTKRMRYTKQEWMKTQAEMAQLFHDLPEALSNTLEIAEKVERYSINNQPIMPYFPIPGNFTDSNEYLRHLTCEGAAKRYQEITEAIKERIDFELATIKKMGYPDYFLIVQDFIAAARAMDVWVGPGRGSAAGSVVAYCLQITDIDPLKYNLLFERFLNPDRISLPDIDIDFDDDGRAKVLKYVEEKYGKDHVSHVITFGTMATKSAIRDVARVQKLPLDKSDKLAKLIPMRWDKKETVVKKDEDGNEEKEEQGLPINLKNCLDHIPELKQEMQSEDPLLQDTFKFAKQLEGSIRNTGVHACAIIIGRNNLMEHIPISSAKDKDTGEDMWVSQYEGSCIEEVGMLKMDFLGLKTLSILRDAIENIKSTRGIDIDLGAISLDDKKTYELFSRGNTVATFQFESDGMRKWLQELEPTRFEDLIAMNALYRPGPMNYIPNFVERKHGREKIEYDLPEMEEFLSDTYGITVYQEQVMLLSQKLAGFTGGQADTLRKAMGKKQKKTLAKMKNDFIAGAIKNGHSEEICTKIWSDWESFAEYAFNKSHSTCYALLGYQTAYLKANYPAEYMAAVLSCNLDNIDEITKLMNECRRMGIAVLGPAINESNRYFTVNEAGNIRFSMAAIKNVGTAAIGAIVNERQQHGHFKNIFDFVERIPLATINRRTMEALVLGGAFDEFKEIKRYQFLSPNAQNEIFLENLLRYASRWQADKQQNTHSLFGGSYDVAIQKPKIPTDVKEWIATETLKKEKELIGIYLSAHPLDVHDFAIRNFTNYTLQDIPDLLSKASNDRDGKLQRQTILLAGIVTKADEAKSKRTEKPYMRFAMEDYTDAMEMPLFGQDYDNFSKYIKPEQVLLLRCQLQKRFRGRDDKRPEEWELKIRSIHNLAHVCDELVQSIQLVLPVEELSASFTQRLTEMISKNQGHITLQLKLTEQKNRLTVALWSRSFRVALTPDFIDFMQSENIKYHLTKKI
ncbi:MAG: DNA polymerase III subunit alpha [Prevotellaceae bacterium]|nr:DNA polymerase III subunit alpha [Prevotellaceae bacterium]